MELCLKCKGRDWCGNPCPIYSKSESLFQIEKFSDKDFFGSGVAPFVGRYGYPFVNVGILSPPKIVENAWLYDAPQAWASQNLEIKKVVELRGSLINSRFKANIKQSNKFLEISQELSMASKPPDVEISIQKKPVFRLNIDDIKTVSGPNVTLNKIRLAENPTIDSKVDKVVSDTDLKANDAVLHLYKHDLDENFLSKILSIGNLGLKNNRKLVPTRWSITATDDIISKDLMKKVKDFNEADYQLYFGSHLGNYYLIMFFPHVWSYELFELYLPKVSWNLTDKHQYTTDYEFYSGRKNYAVNCAGGYYANRLPILERLNKLKRQASVISLRFITDEYDVPLGVWVCREATRKTLNSKQITFSSRDEMLGYAKQLISKKFNYDIDNLLKDSKVFEIIKSQKKLTEFL